MSRLRLHFSDVAVEVAGDADLVHGLRAAWRACQHPLLAARTSHQLEVRSHASKTFDLYMDGQSVARGVAADDLLAVVETHLYHGLLGWHVPRLLLHAACVVARDGRALVLLGESDAGKSTLARAAIEQGMRYFTDELVVADGRQLWGIPRTVQFSPVTVGDTPPSWLGEVDADTYRLRRPHGQRAYLPLWPVPEPAVMRRPVPLSQVQLVRIARGATTDLQPMDTVQGLAWVLEARFPGTRRKPCERLPGHHPPLALTWSDPGLAVRALTSAPRGALGGC